MSGGFFSGVSPGLFYSHVLYNQIFGTSFSPTAGIDNIDVTTSAEETGLTRGKIDALNGLYSRAYDLLNKAEALSTANRDGVFYRQDAVSSDSDVVAVSHFNGNNFNAEVPDQTLRIDVNQLAAEQVNTGDTLNADDASVITTGPGQSVTVTIGSFQP